MRNLHDEELARAIGLAVHVMRSLRWYRAALARQELIDVARRSRLDHHWPLEANETVTDLAVIVPRHALPGRKAQNLDAQIGALGDQLAACDHMRNGITPVVPLRAAGVNVAIGLDDKTINDDEDAVMELRMMHKVVHRLHTFDLETPALTAYEALEIATLNGAKATGFADEVGALVPGMKGDAILADLDRVARDPWIDPEFDITDAFVERAMGADVATVVIGGKIVVENHQPRTIDLDGLYREVRAFCAKGLTPEQRAHADFLRKIKPYVQAWYGTWHETMLDQPFYRVNSRT